MDRSLFADLTPARIALIYVVGGAWIAFSDRLLVAALPPGPLFDAVTTGKGWVFAGVSGVLLYGMVSYRDEQLRDADGTRTVQDATVGPPPRSSDTTSGITVRSSSPVRT
jgi:hypothetical protein